MISVRLAALRRDAVAALAATSLAAITLSCGGGTTGPGGTSSGGFAVFVAVTGLHGSGLVLQNNGTGDFAMPPGGDRAYFQNLAKGSSYNITVKTQPTEPWQTCMVTNPTGTVNADVSSVTVACVTNSYAVRGSVSGLTGSGLSLLMNGAGAQAIVPGISAFSFPGIASMAQYAVTVGVQPAGQTCAVSNASGVVAGADVTSVTVACGAPGFTIGGEVGVGGPGLTLRLNGGTPMPIDASATSFTFPATLPTGATWNVTVVDEPQGPLMTCTLTHGRGRVASANITDLQVQCYSNSTLAAYEGAYVSTVNGKRQYLAVWLDGIYSLATRLDSPTCANAGNGIEYGVYRRSASGAFYIRIGKQDTNGNCGLYDPALTPAPGPTGTLVRDGNTLTLTMPADGPTVLQTVESVPTSLVGAFARADGNDGSFIVFESDGTYMYLEAQSAPELSQFPGYERGCYAVSGATFTTSLGATCRPNNLPALDTNGPGGGFSAKNGAAIPFTIMSPTTVTIDGVSYRRLAPGG